MHPCEEKKYDCRDFFDRLFVWRDVSISNNNKEEFKRQIYSKIDFLIEYFMADSRGQTWSALKNSPLP